jgi:hypothetical protein
MISTTRGAHNVDKSVDMGMDKSGDRIADKTGTELNGVDYCQLSQTSSQLFTDFSHR